MAIASAIRLPGITFLPTPRSTNLELPPLDVAGFVGFAERGALDTPVLIEEFATYRKLFGSDFAWKPDKEGAAIPARLGDAVALFFANGGRRCYVVRVAGRGARRALFTVPNIKRVAPDGTLQPVALEAASEGHWADALQMATRLQSKFLPVTAFQPLERTTTGFALDWDTGGVVSTLQAGDILRVKGAFAKPNTILLLPLSALENTDGGVNRYRITTGQGWIETTDGAGKTELRLADPNALFAAHTTTATLTHIERLRFEIVLEEKGKLQITVTDLAFGSQHARFWGEIAAQKLGGLLSRTRPFRFKGKQFVLDDQGSDGLTDQGMAWGPETVFLPMAMPHVLGNSDFVVPTTAGEDDLTPFPTEAFFDEWLLTSGTTPDSLLQNAQERVLVQGKSLKGMHALMLQEEVALLSVPDALGGDLAVAEGTIPSVEALREAPMVRIQAEMQRFCEARRDVFGVLSLPSAFQKRHCLNWLKALRLQVGLSAESDGAFESAGQADLSYIGVYHPWVRITDPANTGQFKTVPGEGVICGMIARRERERGVWIAPANTPLTGIYGIVPKLSEGDRADLFAANFNLITAEPRDFRALSAHTLSQDKTLQQISVRRLMIVLRKMLLEQGQEYVFENNSPQFREAVRISVANVLERLFTKGAFAGKIPAQSYRVTVDSSVNPPQSVDQGRFVVEVAVAPSQPAEFITVLLIRSGDGSVIVQ